MTNAEDKQSQSERFNRAAEEAGFNLNEEQLKRALRQMKEWPEKEEKNDGGGP